MKTAAIYRSNYAPQPNVPYPNAATRREIFSKFLDLVLIAAIGISAAAILLFMIALA